MQLNQYLEENAIIQLDQKAGKDQGKFQVKTNIKSTKSTTFFLQVNFKKLENSVKDRVKQYVTLQHSGDKEAVEKWADQLTSSNNFPTKFQISFI